MGKWNETALKKLFAKAYKNVFGKSNLGVLWVEPSMGSSIGLADAFVMMDSRLLPVEFKHFRKNQKFRLRASQYVFHKACERDGLPSFVVCSFETPKGIEVIVLSGERIYIHHDKSLMAEDGLFNLSDFGGVLHICHADSLKLSKGVQAYFFHAFFV